MELNEKYDSYCQIERIVGMKRPIKYFKKTYKEIYQMIFKNFSNIYENHINYGKKDNYKFLVKWKGLQYESASWEDEYIVLRFKDVLKKFF